MTAPAIRSTSAPDAVDDIDQRVREWCEALGIPFADLSTEEAPET